MLIKVLSYAASVIGTRRYKPLLLSLVAIAFSVTGITMVISAIGSSTPNAASQVDQQTARTNQQSSSPQVSGAQKSTIDDKKFQDSNGNTASPSSPSDNKPAGSAVQTPPVDIILSTGSIELGKDGQASLTASTTDKSTLAWTLQADATADNLHVTVEDGKESGPATAIQIHAVNASSGSYAYTLTGKDAKGNSISKQFVIVIKQ